MRCFLSGFIHHQFNVRVSCEPVSIPLCTRKGVRSADLSRALEDFFALGSHDSLPWTYSLIRHETLYTMVNAPVFAVGQVQ